MSFYLLSRMARMAWVAQALFITWFAKKSSSSYSFKMFFCSPSLLYLKRKIRPWIGLKAGKVNQICHLLNSCEFFFVQSNKFFNLDTLNSNISYKFSKHTY